MPGPDRGQESNSKDTKPMRREVELPPLGQHDPASLPPQLSSGLAFQLCFAIWPNKTEEGLGLSEEASLWIPSWFLLQLPDPPQTRLPLSPILPASVRAAPFKPPSLLRGPFETEPSGFAAGPHVSTPGSPLGLQAWHPQLCFFPILLLPVFSLRSQQTFQFFTMSSLPNPSCPLPEDQVSPHRPFLSLLRREHSDNVFNKEAPVSPGTSSPLLLPARPTADGKG